MSNEVIRIEAYPPLDGPGPGPSTASFDPTILIVCVVVLIVLLAAVIVFFVCRKSSTFVKGKYDTDEQKGAEMADHPDTAIKYGQTGQPEVAANGQEFYI